LQIHGLCSLRDRIVKNAKSFQRPHGLYSQVAKAMPQPVPASDRQDGT
jgi:hypothetical protein